MDPTQISEEELPFKRLLSVLDHKRPVFVQAHDYPDHDAVACAFSLMELLTLQGFDVQMCYSGLLQSNSLERAVADLAIPLEKARELGMGDDAQIILVDGFVGSKNVSDVPGEIIGVIDHHQAPSQPDVAFFDIRPHYGSCSTMLYEYFHQMGVEPRKDVATALLMGIMMDTAFMTRGVTEHDLAAFSSLYFKGDWQHATRILRNSLSVKDLVVFREAINLCTTVHSFAFIPLPTQCSPEVMALVADFFLGLLELDFVVVLMPDRNEYRISVRSENEQWPADVIIRQAMQGMGYGGGHVHMGGGVIPHELFPGEQRIRARFVQALGLE